MTDGAPSSSTPDPRDPDGAEACRLATLPPELWGAALAEFAWLRSQAELGGVEDEELWAALARPAYRPLLQARSRHRRGI